MGHLPGRGNEPDEAPTRTGAIQNPNRKKIPSSKIQASANPKKRISIRELS
jgi:hypothetical protein